jgi:hypothetical protein
MSDIVMVPVQSSALAEIGYDAERQILQVKHHPNKSGIASSYQYVGVPMFMWAMLGEPGASIGQVMVKVRKMDGVTSVKIGESYEESDALVAHGGAA